MCCRRSACSEVSSASHLATTNSGHEPCGNLLHVAMHTSCPMGYTWIATMTCNKLMVHSLLDQKISALNYTHHTHIRLHTHTYLTFKCLLVMCIEADSV